MNTSTPIRSVITDNCPPVVRTNQLPSYFDKLEPVFREAYLTREYYQLSMQPKLAGVYVIPSFQSANLWFGVIFVHHGLYQGGVFRFTIQFPEAFPVSGQLPKILFHPPIFHPHIHPTKGQLDLKRYFRSGWVKNSHVSQVLQIVKRIFYKIETGHPIDKTAAEMYELHAETYVAKAKQEVELSLERVYDEPPDGFKDAHYIRFSKFEPHLHDSIRAKVLQPNFKNTMLIKTHGREEAAKKGLSFMSDE